MRSIYIAIASSILVLGVCQEDGDGGGNVIDPRAELSQDVRRMAENIVRL